MNMRNIVLDTNSLIIAISANAFADDIQKAKNAGMNEHLAKPFEMEKVLRAISRYHKV